MCYILCKWSRDVSPPVDVYAHRYSFQPRHATPTTPPRFVQVPLGRGGVQFGSGGEPAVRAAVAALPRLPLGLEDVVQGGGGRARDSGALGESERLPSVTDSNGRLICLHVDIYVVPYHSLFGVFWFRQLFGLLWVCGAVQECHGRRGHRDSFIGVHVATSFVDRPPPREGGGGGG